MNTSALYPIISYFLITLGLAGTVLPLVPGPLIIWLGALVWVWGNGFQGIDWVLLLVLGVLAVLAWGTDLLMTTTFSRRAGVSWRSIGAAIVGGLLGGFFLSGIPVLGTILARCSAPPRVCGWQSMWTNAAWGAPLRRCAPTWWARCSRRSSSWPWPSSWSVSLRRVCSYEGTPGDCLCERQSGRLHRPCPLGAAR